MEFWANPLWAHRNLHCLLFSARKAIWWSGKPRKSPLLYSSLILRLNYTKLKHEPIKLTNVPQITCQEIWDFSKHFAKASGRLHFWYSIPPSVTLSNHRVRALTWNSISSKWVVCSPDAFTLCSSVHVTLLWQQRGHKEEHAGLLAEWVTIMYLLLPSPVPFKLIATIFKRGFYNILTLKIFSWVAIQFKSRRPIFSWKTITDRLFMHRISFMPASSPTEVNGSVHAYDVTYMPKYFQD